MPQPTVDRRAIAYRIREDVRILHRYYLNLTTAVHGEPAITEEKLALLGAEVCTLLFFALTVERLLTEDERADLTPQLDAFQHHQALHGIASLTRPLHAAWGESRNLYRALLDFLTKHAHPTNG